MFISRITQSGVQKVPLEAPLKDLYWGHLLRGPGGWHRLSPGCLPINSGDLATARRRNHECNITPAL